MASGSSLGPNFTVTVTDSTDHTDQHGPWGQHGSWIPKLPQMVAQILDIPMALVVMWVMDVNTDPLCSRTTDLDMALGSSPGLESPWSGGKQVTNSSPLVTTFSSSDLCLTLPHTPFSLSLSLPFLNHIFTHHNGAHLSGACLAGWVCGCLWADMILRTQFALWTSFTCLSCISLLCFVHLLFCYFSTNFVYFIMKLFLLSRLL